jgi:uncharacterized protein (DUF433 family)/predicted nucleotidyltransferase
MSAQELLKRITTNPQIFNGKPIIRGHRLAVEHVLGMLAAGDTIETLLEGYPWLEAEDIQACLLYAQNLVRQVRSAPSVDDLASLIPSVLAQAPYITLLVLFGSRARGDADSGSDWDFAFLCDEEQRKSYETGGWDSFRVWGILQNIFDLQDNQIDVVEMKDCSQLLAHYIALDGKVLYEKEPGIFEMFRQNSLMNDAELKEMRQNMREEILQTIQEFKS